MDYTILTKEGIVGLRRRLDGVLGEGRLKMDEPMAAHTTFKVGGPAGLFVTPTHDELGEVLSILAEAAVRPLLVGNGSNLLVSDDGIRGVVEQLAKGISMVSYDEDSDVVTA